MPMYRPAVSHPLPVSFLRTLLQTACVACLGALILTTSSEAKTKRMDDKTLDMAKTLAKDREAAFASGKAMSLDEFKAQWTAFADRLNKMYAGQDVRIDRFGAQVRFRQGFTHLIYMALRVQAQVTPLTPTPQELVAKHPFLQELMLDGSCYANRSRFESKMSDLLAANPDLKFLLQDQLDGWKGKYRSEFEKRYPVQAAKTAD